ncbi:MAG: hypothetical protein P8Y77_04440 [Nitrospirota bacterium]|jgi:molybdopterin-guanine dinucleotide biosynthesis protein
MAPLTVGIGGDRSGSGKTRVAELLLRRLRGWGAVKCSPSSLYVSVIDAPETLSEPGKDTHRFIEAGAEEVLWVRAPRSEIGEPLSIALGKLSHLAGVIVEGNSAVEELKETADVIIFTASGAENGLKDDVEGLLGSAHAVLYEGSPPPAVSEGARLFRREDEDKLIEYVLEILHGREG